jgi:hypothetical protein
MSLWISDHNVSPPAGISSVRNQSLPDDLYFFMFVMAISKLKECTDLELENILIECKT